MRSGYFGNGPFQAIGHRMDQRPYAQIFQEVADAAQRGDFARAEELAQAMLAANENDPNALQVIGLCHARLGRSGEALAAYQKANALAPNQPPILTSLGALLKQHGDLAGASAALEKVTQLAPGFTEAHVNLAAVYVALEDHESARKSFARAIETNPQHGEALAKYAHFLEAAHDLDEARHFAERALAVQPGNAVAHLTMAEIDARTGNHADTISRLQQYLQSQPPAAENAVLMWGRLGKSLEQIECYDDAFAAFSKANDIHKVHYADMIAREQSPRSPENLTRLKAFFESQTNQEWPASDNLSGDDPVFLVGFPRSGTTLLDQILSSHPDITVLEEKENLIDAWTDFILTPGGIERLPGLSPDIINHYRDAYWRRVHSHTNTPSGLIVDKLPLDIALLGFIHRFFPRAKFIFALRDPRDAVFSCFQQTFAMNAAMYQFLSLETSASYYDQVMSLGRLGRQRFALALQEVRYENIIEDLKGEIEPLLTFLGMEWNDQLLRYHELAQKRIIRTPSAKQVIQKPYTSSIGKWRHYEKQMQPVLPILNKWAAQFDYD